MNDTTERFESLLRRMISLHERMLDRVREHRAAISLADTDGIRTSLESQAELMDQISEADRDRLVLITELAATLGSRMPAHPTLSALAEQMPDSEHTVVLAARLKKLMGELQRERGTVRAATESLLAHMEGLMRQVARKLSHAGTYGPGGAVSAGDQQVVSGLDLTH